MKYDIIIPKYDNPRMDRFYHENRVYNGEEGGEVMQFLERAIERRKYLNEELRRIKKEIHSLPAGRLDCIRRDKGYRWYVEKKGERKYLSRTDITTAQRLAYKRTLQDRLDVIRNEIIGLDIYIKVCQRCGLTEAGPIKNDNDTFKTGGRKQVRVKDIVSYDQRRHRQNEEIDRLSKLYWNSTHKDIAEWSDAEYVHRPDDDGRHKAKANSGRLHESKDEALIDNALVAHGLKVRYEPELVLGDEIVYPDFQIMNPKTNKPLYWEHFGMMDQPSYFRHNIWKLRKYIENGYYPGVNFIATFMGGEYRIDSQYVETIIEYFFE